MVGNPVITHTKLAAEQLFLLKSYMLPDKKRPVHMQKPLSKIDGKFLNTVFARDTLRLRAHRSG